MAQIKVNCPKCGAFAKEKMHRRNALGTYDHTLFFCEGRIDKKTGKPLHEPLNFIRQLEGIVL